MATACLTSYYISARSNVILAHSDESFLGRFLSNFFPPASLGRMENFSESLSYDYRMNRNGIEPAIDHTRVWNMVQSPDGIARWEASDIQPFISGARLGDVTIGEARPTYAPGTRERRAALRRGEI